MPQTRARPAGEGPGRAALGFRWAAETGATNSEIEGLRQESARRLRRQRLVERVHRLGARVAFELLAELARHHGIAGDIDRRLARYAALDPEILAALNADRFPADPIRAVGGRR